MEDSCWRYQRRLAQTRRYDAIVALGAVVRGQTSHFDIVAGENASGLSRVQLESGVPVGNGVLTTESMEQAIDRAAMRANLRDTDAYLGEWRRSEPRECSDDLEAEAAALSEKLNAEYDEARLKALVMAGGKLDGAAGE